MFINHKRCPDCGTRLRKNDWRCRDCESQSLTNWPLTLTLGLVFIAVIGFFVLNFLGTACNSSLVQQIAINWGVSC